MFLWKLLGSVTIDITWESNSTYVPCTDPVLYGYDGLRLASNLHVFTKTIDYAYS